MFGGMSRPVVEWYTSSGQGFVCMYCGAAWFAFVCTGPLHTVLVDTPTPCAWLEQAVPLQPDALCLPVMCIDDLLPS